MSENLVFETKKRERTPKTFHLDGEEYTFIPPKKATMVLEVVDDPDKTVKALFDWLGDGLGEEQEAKIIARLNDPEDDFDVDDLTKIAYALLDAPDEQTANRADRRARRKR